VATIFVAENDFHAEWMGQFLIGAGPLRSSNG
jgi:hypothetical protein